MSKIDGDKKGFAFLKKTLNDVIVVTKTLIDNISVNQKNLFKLDDIFSQKIIQINQLMDKMKLNTESNDQNTKNLD
jgi:hypothetical protein